MTNARPVPGPRGSLPCPVLCSPAPGSQPGRSVFGAGAEMKQTPRGCQVAPRSAAQMPPGDGVLLSPNAGGCWNVSPRALYKGRAKELARRALAGRSGCKEADGDAVPGPHAPPAMVGLKPPEVPPPAAVKFLSAGTAACIADVCTFPLDTAKVRLQIQGEVRIPRSPSTVEYRGVLGTLSTMVRTEGPRSLYSGLAAGLQRQMSFASIRIGLYDSVKQLYTPKGAESTGLAARLLAGCTTGAVAVTCAQPTDVVKVRFQAHAALPDSARRYSGTVDAYRTIAREEGVRGLWRGTLPNIARNAIVNCGELVTYDLLKDALLRAQLMTDNVPCHFVAAFGAGFCATVVASPVDVVKTRYMNAGPGQYRNVLSCLLALLMQDGLAGLYKGFVPSFLRLGSWNVVMFISYEQLQRAAVLARPAPP